MGGGREFEGKNLRDALGAAARTLGAAPDQIQYELRSEGRRGVFGIGARKVRIWVKAPEAGGDAATRLEASFDRAARPEECAWAERTLVEILRHMGFDLEVHASPGPEAAVSVDLAGPDAHHLLSRDGELLIALQFVMNRMARKTAGLGRRIQLECQGYRDRRDRELVDLTRRAANEVMRTGNPWWLRAMNPYERRLVHMTVAEFPGLVSESEGPGFLKRVCVSLADSKGEA